jgi:tetraacyldisaccharide 4'-kinase
LTTEKDFVKLQDEVLRTLLADLPLYYVPIEVQFLPSNHNFDTWLTEQLSNLQAKQQ